nr:exported nucleotide-binding protein [Cystobacter sp.]
MRFNSGIGLAVTVAVGVTAGGCGPDAARARPEANEGQASTALTYNPGVHLWSKSFGDASQQWVEDVAADGAGHAVVVGHYSGSLFDLGQGPLPAAGYYPSLYVARFNGTGQTVWSRAVPGINDDDFGFVGYERQVVTDAANNIVIAGNYYGAPDFGCGPLTQGSGVFTVKLDSAGQCVWSRAFPGAFVEHPRLAVDADGKLALAGGFSGGTLDFGGGPLTASQHDLFLARLDGSGNHVWSSRFEATGGGAFAPELGVATDGAGNVLLTGGFSGYASFGASAMRSRGGMDLFIARFNATGGLMWGRRFGDAADQAGAAVAADAAGNMVLTGGFGGTLNIDGFSLTASTPSDAFLLKLDATGHHVWSQAFTDADGTGVQQGTGVEVDRNGNITASGSYTGHIDLGAGPLEREGNTKRYVASFEGTGRLVWQLDFVNDGTAFDAHVAVDPVSDVFVTGQYTGSARFFGPTFQSQGGTDVFLGKYTVH